MAHFGVTMKSLLRERSDRVRKGDHGFEQILQIILGLSF